MLALHPGYLVTLIISALEMMMRNYREKKPKHFPNTRKGWADLSPCHAVVMWYVVVMWDIR